MMILECCIIMDDKMTYNKKYSLGIYENDWGFMVGSEGNPHIFLGLKIETEQCNEMQIYMQKRLYDGFVQNNMIETANRCKLKIKQMECFIIESTLNDLREKLDKEYKYTFIGDKKYKAWQDTITDTDDSFNKDFNKELREKLNADFTFLRQCYTDITEPFFQWLEKIKQETFTEQDEFSKFESLFNEFAESKYSNIDSIEGFFGFGPYETGLFRSYENNNLQTGGKVFQNNHWNDEFNQKTQEQYNKIKETLTNKLLPRMPCDTNDKNFFVYSLDHSLTFMRPLKSFQQDFSEIIEINKNEYKDIAKQILFQTLLTSSKIRKYHKIFSNNNNIFKDYKLIGNSCVDFVMNKLQLIGADKYDKMFSVEPHDVIIHIINNKQKDKYKQPLSKTNKISLLLCNISLFYQNYYALCNLDSSWDCKNGLSAFAKHCQNLINLDNLIFPYLDKEYLKSKQKDIASLNDLKIKFGYCISNEYLSPNEIKLEYEQYCQYCIANNKSQIAYDEFSEIKKQADLARRINVGIYVLNEMKDIERLTNNDKSNNISLLIFDKHKERFLVANKQNNFSYNNFDLSNLNYAYAYVIKKHKLITADNIIFNETITQESIKTYIKSFIAVASGNFDNYQNNIARDGRYYTQQHKENNYA